MLRGCAEFELAKADAAAGAFGEVSALLATAKTGLAPDEVGVLDLVGQLCSSLEQACRWIVAKGAGVADADRFLEAARTGATIARESLPKVRFAAFRVAADKALKSLADLNTVTGMTMIATEVAAITIAGR